MSDWFDDEYYIGCGKAFEVYALPDPAMSESMTKNGEFDILWIPMLQSIITQYLTTGRLYSFHYQGEDIFSYVGTKKFWKEPNKIMHTFRTVPAYYDDICYNNKILKEIHK